jgi:hypothetical protein
VTTPRTPEDWAECLARAMAADFAERVLLPTISLARFIKERDMKTEFTADVPLPPHNPEMEDASKRVPDLSEARAFQDDRVAIQADHHPSEMANDPLLYATTQCLALQTRIDSLNHDLAVMRADLASERNQCVALRSGRDWWQRRAMERLEGMIGVVELRAKERYGWKVERWIWRVGYVVIGVLFIICAIAGGLDG